MTGMSSTSLTTDARIMTVIAKIVRAWAWIYLAVTLLAIAVSDTISVRHLYGFGAALTCGVFSYLLRRFVRAGVTDTKDGQA